MCFITVHIFEIYIISSFSTAIMVYTKTVILVHIKFSITQEKRLSVILLILAKFINFVS